MSNKPEWENVSEEFRCSWINTFSTSREGLNLSSPCPVCGHTTLHHYYQPVGPKTNFILHNKNYVGRGDLWEWCSFCHTFERYYAAIPDWWDCEVSLDNSCLIACPDVLEQAIYGTSM